MKNIIRKSLNTAIENKLLSFDINHGIIGAEETAEFICAVIKPFFIDFGNENSNDQNDISNPEVQSIMTCVEAIDSIVKK